MLALEGAICFLDYEVIHQTQKCGSLVLGVLSVILSWRILDKADLPVHSTVHGEVRSCNVRSDVNHRFQQ